MLPVDDIMFIGHVAWRPITGLSGLFLYKMHMTAEASDWRRCRVADGRGVIDREHQKQWQHWNRENFTGELTFHFSF